MMFYHRSPKGAGLRPDGDFELALDEGFGLAPSARYGWEF